MLGLSVVAAAGIGAYVYTRHLSSSAAFQTARVTRGPLVAAVAATGTLNAVVTVQVGSQVSGQIKELYADFNSKVTKGQIIARIDPAIFQAQVDQAPGAGPGCARDRAGPEGDLHQDQGRPRERGPPSRSRKRRPRRPVALVDGQRNLDRQRQLKDRED